MLKFIFIFMIMFILTGASISSSFEIQSHCNSPNMITLSFDDGVSENFNNLVSILDKEHIKATFFIIGTTLLNPYKLQAIKTASEHGHTIANHTWTHRNLNKLTDQEIKIEVKQTQNGISSVAPKSPLYIRPPYGSFDHRVYKLLTEMGYTIILWNLDTKDWNMKTSRNKIWYNFTNALNKPNSNNFSFISLQHDKRLTSVELVSSFIKFARSRGFDIVSIQECTKNIQH